MFSIALYYGSVLLLNADLIAKEFQPQMNQLFIRLMSTGMTWIVIAFAPLVALLPDLVLCLWRSLFRKNPIDRLMVHQALERHDSSQRYLM